MKAPFQRYADRPRRPLRPDHPRGLARAAAGSVLAAVALLLGGGCGEDSKPLQEITTQQITGNAPAVFDGAPAEVRQLAADVVAAIEAQDFSTAWEKLQILSGRDGLTDAQKEFIAESTATVGAEVNNAEAAGNEGAQQTLQFHRANK